MKLTFVLNNIQKNCLTNILYVIACYDWENSQATSIDLDCHIVHVCSSIYLDYFFIYAYALLLIQNLNVIRAFMICLCLFVATYMLHCGALIGNGGIIKSKYTCK